MWLKSGLGEEKYSSVTAALCQLLKFRGATFARMAVFLPIDSISTNRFRPKGLKEKV